MRRGTYQAESLESRVLLSTAVSGYTFENGAYLGQGISSTVVNAKGDLFGVVQPLTIGQFSGIFEVAAGPTTVIPLVPFNSPAEGTPGGLALDSQGNLFGIAGGAPSGAIAYAFELTAKRIAADISKLKTLATFSGPSGATVGNVTLDSHDDLYGVITNLGANGGVGNVFEIVAGSGQVTTLLSLGNGSEIPSSSLAADARGDVFGSLSVVDSSQNLTGEGSLFEITGPSIAKGSPTLSTVVSYTGADGQTISNLVMDASGNLYGTTSS
ncbi:MAG: hypothetical protein ABSH22_05920, partial [Tepidisphaeraceae bacterium]